MKPTTIVAEMQDGTCLVEHVATFEDFTAIVLPLRADSECVRLTWHTTPPAPPASTLNEAIQAMYWADQRQRGRQVGGVV